MMKVARVRVPVTITRWAEVLVSFDSLLDDGSTAVDDVDPKLVLEQTCTCKEDEDGAEIQWDDAETYIENDYEDD